MFTLRKLLFALAVVGLAVSNLEAQGPVYERILLPIALARPVPGAFGSLWSTEVKAHASGGPVRFRQFTQCFACLPIFDIAPDTTVDLPAVGRVQGQPLGTIIYLDRATAANVQLNLRVTDLSRQALTWGTELPIVRERDFFTTPLTLINVPTDSRFRQALRIYDVDSN